MGGVGNEIKSVKTYLAMLFLLDSNIKMHVFL